MMVLEPGHVTLTQLQTIYEGIGPIGLGPACYARVQVSADHVARALEGSAAVYGINTGFGKLAQMRIAAEDTITIQRNLILSHCCGVGAPIDPATTRLMMALKLISLGRGASGVRPEIIATLEKILAAGITPLVPSQGSVGASGDLAPLAHVAAVMIGEGRARLPDEQEVSGAQALASADIEPVSLGPKEGLALINGTQFSTALALAQLFELWRCAGAQVAVAALATDAIMGSDAPLHPDIHRLRGHRGQIEVADAMAALLDSSEIRNSHREDDLRVQDPYCIRCQPQVAGAALDLIRFAAQTLQVEANAVTDNPLVLDSGEILSGGNFHAEPVAFAADQLALAIAELGAISQRRTALMVDPVMNHNLPAFLSPAPGLNSGFMIAEVTTAALMSENKHLANPCSTDSTPTSANQEDHVSMAAHGALRLGRMVCNLQYIIGVEALCAAQGIEARAPLKTAPRLQPIMQKLRARIAPLGQDRFMADDLNAAAQLVASGALSNATGLVLERAQ
ncbi:MAG: histidine ammonia-lyase [Pseudomonadota bacterium]